jgi:hypothetical protein
VLLGTRSSPVCEGRGEPGHAPQGQKAGQVQKIGLKTKKGQAPYRAAPRRSK